MCHADQVFGGPRIEVIEDVSEVAVSVERVAVLVPVYRVMLVGVASIAHVSRLAVPIVLRQG